MLSDIVGKNKIILQQKTDTWEHAIKLAAQPLLNNNYINTTYITAMIESVKKYGPYIVISKGVALAHARSEDGVKNMGMSIMTLSNPICFGNKENDPVKIIFCLAAANNDMHLNLMKSLVKIINENWKVDYLTNIVKINEFMIALDRLENDK